MIYVNGDSYSLSDGKNYGNYLSELTGQPLMHKGISGSSNARIFRTTARDLLKLKQQRVNECQVCIGLSFWFRTELWIDEHGIGKWYQFEFDDGEFASFQSATNSNWFTSGPVPSADAPKFYQPFLKEWAKTTQADSAITNTLHQASLLKHLCNSLGYKLIIFWAAEVMEDISRINPNLDCLKDFYAEFDQTNSFDLLNYSFVNTYNQIRPPYDYDLHGDHGHPNTQSHEEFAGEINDRLTRY
jgi:hypothetical protein